MSRNNNVEKTDKNKNINEYEHDNTNVTKQ